MMSISTDLLHRAQAWLDTDPDPETRQELSALLEAAEADPNSAEAKELAERFSGFLQFGTAGLRAELGAGPMRMNRVVVRKAAAGLAAYATERAKREQWDKITAVVGYDARFKSDIFAEETAAIFTAAGIQTKLMPTFCPTPVLAWSTRLFDAEIGVMVTASHNPPNDNGYKVYLGGNAVEEAGKGSQIVPPYDADIARAIAAVEDVELAEYGWEVLDESILSQYADMVDTLVESTSRDLRIVYTAMHGVGGQTVSRVLKAAGFGNIITVDEQFTPDPNFPTVAFPNPEEPGALDLALALAEESDADLIIANDPDADRAAFAFNDRGSWRMLRGDEVGSLLGVAMLSRLSDADKESAVFANSIVSSRQLAAIAKAHGVAHRETLTGFKWISRIENLAYGYEEALGYCVDPASVRDKDGISAALLMAEYAQQLKDAGQSIADALDGIASTYGVYATDQLSIRVEELVRIGVMMNRLRSAPPKNLADSPVLERIDLSEGSEDLPPTDGLLFRTTDNSRVIVRPSGTEPKLKCYLEVVEEVQGDLAAARSRAAEKLAQLKTDMALALGVEQ